MNETEQTGTALLEENEINLKGYADPKNNLTFLRLFASDRNRDLTKHLLNSMLGLFGQNAIVEITITDPRVIPEDLKKKSNIIDIYCKDERGHRFVIEMQVQQQDFFFQRAMHVTCNAFSNQLERGKDYSQLKPVWFLGILDFEMFPEPEYFSEHLIINQKSGICYNEFVKYCFVELPKLRDVKTERDQWVRFFTTKNGEEGMPREIRSSKIKQAYQEISILGWSKEDREDYKKSLLGRVDIKNAMNREHRKGKEEGLKEGKEKGLKEGKEKGLKEGERKKQCEIAKKLLLKMSPEEVAKLTGLSNKEVLELKNEFPS